MKYHDGQSFPDFFIHYNLNFEELMVIFGMN